MYFWPSLLAATILYNYSFMRLIAGQQVTYKTNRSNFAG